MGNLRAFENKEDTGRYSLGGIEQGIMEWWNTGTVECDDVLETPFRIPETHYSITPLFQYSFVLIARHHELRQ